MRDIPVGLITGYMGVGSVCQHLLYKFGLVNGCQQTYHQCTCRYGQCSVLSLGTISSEGSILNKELGGRCLPPPPSHNFWIFVYSLRFILL